MKAILNKLNACQEAVEWAENKPIEEIINTCHRGDWLLWLARKLDVDLQNITLAKGLCANTVIHLMKDDRSINAVNAAIAFGRGEITRAELDAAAAASYAAAASSSYADAASSYADAAASYAAAAASYAAAAARIKNQLLTANICRDVLGKILIHKLITYKSE